MYLLTSQDDCVYRLSARLGSNVHNIEPLRVQFHSQVLRWLPAKVLEEQEDCLSRAAQAAREAMNPADWVSLRTFVKMAIESDDGQPLSFTRESRSVGLAYGLVLALVFREQLNKNDGELPIWFATGELYPTGRVYSVGHILSKGRAVRNFIKQYRQSQQHRSEKKRDNPEQPFFIFYPADNCNDWSSKDGIELQQELLRLGGRLVAINHLPEALGYLLGDRYESQKVSNPFKGLSSFDYQDQHRFFGRDTLLERLIDEYQKSRGLFVVTGVSGSGKSSLIKAGLIPQLVQQDTETQWQVIRPSDFSHPKELLAHICSNSFPLPDRIAVNQWLDCVWQSADVLKMPFSPSDKASNGSEYTRINSENLDCFFWYIDQYEEVLSQAKAEDWSNLSRCLQAMALEFSRVRVMVSVRSEYLSQLGGSYTELHVSHALSPSEWKALLTRQALSSGLHFEDGLVDRLIQEALNTQHALPAMQYLLTQMYGLAESENTNILTHAHYDHVDIGGLAGAIASQAQRVFKESSDQAELHQIFEMFVGISFDGSWYARRVPWTYFENDPILSDLVNKLVNAQLMVRQDVAIDTFEDRFNADDAMTNQAIRFAHDCLISSNSPWEALTDWMKSRREYLLWFLTWESDYRNWLQHLQHAPQNASQWLLPERELEKAKQSLDEEWTSIQSVKAYLIASLKKQEKVKKRRLKYLILLITLLTLSAAGGIVAWLEQQRSAELLDQVKDNLAFLNGDLKQAVQEYLPTKQQMDVLNQVDVLIQTMDINSEESNTLDQQRLNYIQEKVRLALQKEAMPLNHILELIDQADEILKRRMVGSPNDPQTQFELAKNDIFRGDWLFKNGSMDQAWVIYKQGHQRLMNLIKYQSAHKSFHQWLGALAESHKRLGDWLLEMGDAKQALLSYQVALEHFQRLFIEDQNNTNWLKSLISVQLDLAGLYREDSQYQKAKKLLQSALIAASELSLSNPKHQGYRIHLAKIHGQFALLYSVLQKSNLADQSFEQCIDAWETLHHSDTQNIRFLSSLVTSYLYWADVFTQVNSEREHQLLSTAQPLSEKLLEIDPSSQLFTRISSALYQRLGDLAKFQNDPNRASLAYQRVLANAQTLLDTHPEHSEYQRDIALAYSSLGRLEKSSNNWYLASEHLTDSLGFSQILVDRYPENYLFREDLYWVQRNIAELIDASTKKSGHQQTKNNHLSRKLPNHSKQYWWELAYRNAKILVTNAPENPEFQTQYKETQKVIDGLRRSN